MEISQSCSAVIGERSSSCCRKILPFVLRIAVPHSLYKELTIGEDLLHYNLDDLPYLNIFNKQNIETITVIEKGRWGEEEFGGKDL